MKTNDELLAEAQQHVEMAVTILAILSNRLAHCDDDKVMLRVAPPKNEYFEDCNKCIHNEDTEEICKMRLCVHAIGGLTECYKPRGEEKP